MVLLLLFCLGFFVVLIWLFFCFVFFLFIWLVFVENLFIVYRVLYKVLVLFVAIFCVWYESTNLGFILSKTSRFCVGNGQSYVNLINLFLVPLAKLKTKAETFFQNFISGDISPLWGCQGLEQSIPILSIFQLINFYPFSFCHLLHLVVPRGL